MNRSSTEDQPVVELMAGALCGETRWSIGYEMGNEEVMSGSPDRSGSHILVKEEAQQKERVYFAGKVSAGCSR